MTAINFRGKELIYANQKGFFKLVELGQWETETFDVLDKYIVPGKSFIDIGAWCGILSIYAAKIGAIVYSVEPDQISFDELYLNMVENNFPQKWDTHNIAISNKNGKANLNSMSNAFGNSESSLMERGIIDGEKEVNTQTIGEYIRVQEIINICLIKIDIEGGEYLLINDETLDTLKKCDYPTLYISFHPSWIPDMKNLIQNFIPFLEKYTMFNRLMKEVSIEDFETAMQHTSDHSFLLTHKN